MNNKKEPIVFILWGNFARDKKKYITNKTHKVIESAHPSPFSAYNGFFGSKPFSKTNEYLKKYGLKPINWQEYTRYSYYDAASVTWGAFGLNSDFSPDFIVAKAVNEYGTFYSFRCKITYANALEDARAYLACKVEQARYLAKHKQNQEMTENSK